MRAWWVIGVVLLGCQKLSGPAPPRELYNRLLNVRALAFSPDGKLLVAGRSRGSGAASADLMVWDGGGEGSLREVKAHPKSVIGVRFDGDKCISAGEDGTLITWTKDWTASPPVGSGPWYGSMAGSAVLHGPGPSTFQPGAAEIEIWDVEAGRKVRSFAVPGASMLSAGADVLATGPDVALWNAQGESLGRLDVQATALSVSPDGQSVATGTADGALAVWDCKTQKRRGSLPSFGQRVTGLAWSQDGKRLAVGGETRVAVVEGERFAWEQTVDGYAGPSVLAFSPDGSRLATAGASKVLLWSGL